jgi:hypothetical protein
LARLRHRRFERAGAPTIADHDLIDEYITTLAGRLPVDAVDELADGLTETYRHHLSHGLDPGPTAQVAMDEFGEADVVIATFVRQSLGRRAALTTLYTGQSSGRAGPPPWSTATPGPGRSR